MADMVTKASLKDLTDADLLRIVANPQVGREWAKIAKVNYAELKRGNGKAMRSVRVAIMKRHGGFAHSLAHAWEFLLNPAEVEDPDVDVLVLHAEMAGLQLGPSGGRAMLHALADDNHLADAAAVRDRLEELLEAVERGSHYELPEEDEFSEAAPGDTEGNDGKGDDDADEDEVESVDLEDLQERAAALLEQAPALVEQLRAAADAIEQGTPAATLGESPDNWSDAAQSVLDEAVTAGIEDRATLPAVLDHLRALSEERAQHESERRSNAELALQMIDLLRKAGQTEKIAAQLAVHGFASIEEVEEAAAHPSSPSVTNDAPEPDTATVDEPVVPEVETPSAVAEEEAEATPPPAPPTTLPADDSPAPPADDPAATTVEPVEAANAPAPATPPAADVPPVATAPAERQASPTLTEPPATPAVAKPAESTASLDEWPWDEGDPPVIGRVLLEGREALAYYLAKAAAETQARQQLLLFACAAANCSPSAIELSLLPSDADIKAFDTNESLLLLAASLRAGLRLGYPPLGLQSLLDAADAALTDSSLRAVLHAAAAAVQRGHDRRQPPSGPSAEEMAGRWAELGAGAAQHLERLPDKTLKFQRGSKVLRHLCREGQPLADALSRAAALTAQGISSASDPEWAQIEDFVEQLRDPGDRERLLAAAEAAVSTPQQRQRRPIDGPVKIQLDDLLREAGDLLSRLLTVRRAILTAGDLKDMAVTDDLERALAQAPSSPPVHSVGDAAVANLVQWLRADDVDPAAPSVDDVLNAALLELFEISHDEQGRPQREPTPAEVSVLLESRDPDQVVSGYLTRGNIAAARDFIAARGLEDAGYEDRILKAIKTAKGNFDKAHGQAEEGAARLRAVYNDDLARDLGERIRQIVETPRRDRFDLAIEKLQAITEEAEAALLAERDRLKAQVESLSCDEASKARVLQRIEERDEPLAVHFLSVLRAGGVLQEVEAPSGDDFSQFVPRVVDAATAAQAAGEDAVAAVREALHATAAPAHRFLRDGLVAWQNLKTRKRSGDDFKHSLGDVLRMVGLTPKAHGWYRGEVSRTTAGGYATIRVGADPVDRSYVPQFGSQALGEYDITLVWDPASPSRLMDFIGEGNRNLANIIVYFGTLSLADRRHLRTLTTDAGGKGFSPLVIDEAVIGWLSHLTEPGWRFTQRVTLPFTTLNPYQPNAAGEVPEEVFVGRSDERARIENPTGSMFVYGGRQLGKSALLKRVEHLYTDLRPNENGVIAGKAAVYVDLKAAGIGEAHQPAQLWPLLGERLHSAGILSGKSAPRSAREVTAGILDFLNAEDSNRLLLLLDEADNFLTADSKPREGDLGGFPVLNALKNVMDQSHRRFKAVFAGLHQVQRFFDASNTPVAHGGDAIPIGPLRTHDASDLVVSPLGALGYRFENPELVWRLLLVTNYQASLVQIVCEALVRHLQKRPIPESGGRMVITAEDVRDVCADPKVSDSIAQRFRWTIHLDSRYRVIALVVAFNSIGADPGVRFSVDELREWCEVWWPAGFSPDELSRNEFERYLVEMKGLGILQEPEPEMWALRSPNIIQMLGTRDRLEKELEEAATHLERPLEYNPTMARHIMGDSEGPAAPRSPLTDAELTALLKDSATAQVVIGSPALGIDRVVEVVARQAHRETLNPAIVVNSLQDPELRRVGAGGKRVHVIVDLTGAKPDGNLAHICREAAARKSVTATVVIGPAWLDSLDALGEVTVHKLRRWSTAGLRAWYNSPFDSPADRARLHRVTSGWPKLIEEVMVDFALKGCSPQEALELLAGRLATPERAKQMLADAAIDPQIAKAWVTSIPFIDDEQVPASVEDVTELLGLDGAQTLGCLESLDVADQDGDNWVLDRVILAAAATLYRWSE
jgi:hypothetical protein